MKEYIKESNKKVLNEWKEWFLYKTIPFKILKSFNPNIQVPKIISLIEKTLNNIKYFSYLEGIYIGEFPFLKDRNIQAMFNDGIIYVSNFINDPNINEARIAKDIIHETGHSLEEVYSLDLYGDGNIEAEFLGKRQRLYDILPSEWKINFSRKQFLSTPEFNLSIDNILYKQIGYNNLMPLINGLFLSPYCVTSINEYFANSFETFYSEDKRYIKNISPILFSKLEMLEMLIKEN